MVVLIFFGDARVVQKYDSSPARHCRETKLCFVCCTVVHYAIIEKVNNFSKNSNLTVSEIILLVGITTVLFGRRVP